MVHHGSFSPRFIIAGVCLTLSACGWVDSAGTASDAEAAQFQAPEILLNDMPAGDAIAIDEQTDVPLVVAAITGTGPVQSFQWSDAPLEQGKLPDCDILDDFSTELAAETLLEACKNPAECAIEFDGPNTQAPAAEDNDTTASSRAEFMLSVPALDASIGVRHSLAITDSLGNQSASTYTFCLIAVNDPPIANDDTFELLEGSVLNVTADMVNLLTNDEDDTDVSNEPLRVLNNPKVAPSTAAFFVLNDDGSFTYQTSAQNLNDIKSDSFEYEITDGKSVVSAKATIQFIAVNKAPEQTAVIPLLEGIEDVPLEYSLANSFADPDQQEITFSLSDVTPLPTGSGLTLSPAGLLSGIPTPADVGSMVLTIVVSDGELDTEAAVLLEIDAAPIPVPNSAPRFVAQSVFSQTVSPGFSITPVRPQFTDEDGDRLTYSMAGSEILPEGVSINPDTGVISGIPLEPGIFRRLRVRATDPSGESVVSTPFRLTVASV